MGFRLTLAEARALNIPEEYMHGLKPIVPDALMAQARTRLGVIPGDPGDLKLPVPAIDLPPGRNQTERAFAVMLARADRDMVTAWWHEPFKFRLAGKTFYTPDFGVEVYAGKVCMVEIKGFMRDDAAVKIKVAAEKYPCFRWLLVTRGKGGGWEVRQVGRSGIDREPIAVEWIEGSG